MPYPNIPLGTPEECNVLIEIPMGSANKYEADEASGLMKLDFVFSGGLVFPYNYGFVPNTKAEDGDHLDAIVLSTEAIAPSTIVTVKPVAILKLKDRGEQDNKLICVPIVDPLAKNVNDLQDVSLKQQEEITQFLEQIAVQKNKTIEIQGFYNKAAAVAEVQTRMV